MCGITSSGKTASSRHHPSRSFNPAVPRTRRHHSRRYRELSSTHPLSERLSRWQKAHCQPGSAPLHRFLPARLRLFRNPGRSLQPKEQLHRALCEGQPLRTLSLLTLHRTLRQLTLTGPGTNSMSELSREFSREHRAFPHRRPHPLRWPLDRLSRRGDPQLVRHALRLLHRLRALFLLLRQDTRRRLLAFCSPTPPQPPPLPTQSDRRQHRQGHTGP